MLKSVVVEEVEKVADLVRELTKPDSRHNRNIPFRHHYPELSIVDDGHPQGLGNPKILRSIFFHLSIPDLVTIRRVNLRWNFLACEYLQQRLPLCRIPPSRMKRFTKLMKKSVCNPFGSYAIRVANTDEPLISQFMSDFQFDIVILRMKLPGNEMPALSGLLYQLKNLKELHIIRIPEDYAQRKYASINVFSKYKAYPLSNLQSILLEKENVETPFSMTYDRCVINIINSCPNLKHLQFINWETSFSNLWKACADNFPNPRYFNAWNIINPENLIKVLESGLQFRTAKLDLGKDPQIMINWLQTQSSTLQCLSIKTHNDELRVDTFPILTQLLRLYLHKCNEPIDFSSLSHTFPNLNTLSLNSHSLESISSNDADNISLKIKCTTLKVLILMPLLTSVNKNALLKLGAYFPRVDQLFVQLNGVDSAHVIYKAWPQLQVLFLDFKENVTDEAITGIPIESMKVKESLDCGCSHIRYPKDQQRSSSIKDLKGLLILVIRCGEGLTNISLVEAICHLENLQRLWLLPNPEENFSYHWCLPAIADGLKGLQQLAIGINAEYSKESQDYMQEKMPFLDLQFK